jgi:NADP-dependent 3-hydroxy acid dehydrogenase YdfG
MSRLTGKRVLVTGGGSGIGLAAARLFLQEGAHVAISGRDAAKLTRAANELKAGDSIVTLPCDVGDAKQVQAIVKQLTASWGGIDILVNNAGANIKDRAFRQVTPETWDYLIRANLNGAFYCTHAVLPQMLERKDGVIVNVVSISGKRAGPLGGVAYAAAKFGMGAMGICLAAEEKDSGVRVSNIYPGEVDTPILENRPTPLSPDHRAKILKAEDVAEAVLFVATLPAHVSVPELIIKPTNAVYI